VADPHAPGPLSCPNGCTCDMPDHYRCPKCKRGFSIEEIARAAYQRGLAQGWDEGHEACYDTIVQCPFDKSPLNEALDMPNPHRKTEVKDG